jgi:hypothetical protein
MDDCRSDGKRREVPNIAAHFSRRLKGMKRTPNENRERPVHREKLVDSKTGKTIVEPGKLMELEGAGGERLKDTSKKSGANLPGQRD